MGVDLGRADSNLVDLSRVLFHAHSRQVLRTAMQVVVEIHRVALDWTSV